MPIKIPASYFMGIYNVVLTFIEKGESFRTVNTILKKRVGVLILLDIKTYSSYKLLLT